MELSRITDSQLRAGVGAKLVEQSARPGGVELVSASRTNKTASPHDIVELAAVVQRGDEGVHNAACNKLSVIADQIRYLQEQAKKVLEKAKRDSELHHAACNIVKKPGQIYYLYEKEESGEKYISIISPKEWGSSISGPKTCHGAYRMEIDRTWTPIEEIMHKDEEQLMLDTVLSSKQGIIRAAISMEQYNKPN